MHSDSLAELVLVLVLPPERAAAAIGDLLEDRERRGDAWFWTSVVRTVIATISAQITSMPIRMLMYAVIGWFGYMLAAILLLVAGVMVLTVLRLAFDVLAAHTGVELLVNAIPSGLSLTTPKQALLTRLGELFILVVAAPYFSGRRFVDIWQERAVALTVMAAIVWPVLAGVIPFVGSAGTRVSGRMLWVIVPCLLLGVARARLAALRQRAVA